jgi:hypothetical protein
MVFLLDTCANLVLVFGIDSGSDSVEDSKNLTTGQEKPSVLTADGMYRNISDPNVDPIGCSNVTVRSGQEPNVELNGRLQYEIDPSATTL